MKKAIKRASKKLGLELLLGLGAFAIGFGAVFLLGFKIAFSALVVLLFGLVCTHSYQEAKEEIAYEDMEAEFWAEVQKCEDCPPCNPIETPIQ